MRRVYIKGASGEIIKLDSINRLWKTLGEKTNDWVLWVESNNHQSKIFQGSETEVNDLFDALDDLFEPFDLTNPEDRETLKKSRKFRE